MKLEFQFVVAYYKKSTNDDFSFEGSLYGSKLIDVIDSIVRFYMYDDDIERIQFEHIWLVIRNQYDDIIESIPVDMSYIQEYIDTHTNIKSDFIDFIY